MRLRDAILGALFPSGLLDVLLPFPESSTVDGSVLLVAAVGGSDLRVGLEVDGSTAGV